MSGVIPRYRLHIGCPTYNKPDTQFSMDSYGTLLWHLGRNHPEIKNIYTHRDVRTYRQEARNNIVREALKENCTHLLMLDDDMVFDPEVFDKVWEVVLKEPKPCMVSALYFTRGYPATAPCMFRLTREGTVPIFEYPDNTVLTEDDGVEVLGFGFVLFDMRLFDTILEPWFNLGFGFGEDAAFCTRLVQSGYGLRVHTGAKVGHIHEDPNVITEQTYLACKQALLQGAIYEDSQLVRIDATEAYAGAKASSGRYPQTSLAARTGWRGSPTKLLQRLFAGQPGSPANNGLGGAAANGGREEAKRLVLSFAPSPTGESGGEPDPNDTPGGKAA